jgi:hypothetical protein
MPVLRVLICSEADLGAELASTLIGRQGVDRLKAGSLDEARTLCAALFPGAILIDRDHPAVRELVEGLREDPATRSRSLAVLARGEMQPIEVELLEAGANAVLRLPPDAGWDERLSRLLSVPARHDARLPVRLALEGGDAAPAVVLNISAGGMLLESALPLQVGQELSFSFSLPDGARVEGHGRVARQAGPGLNGIEFLSPARESQDAIRSYVRSAQMERAGQA